MAIKVGMLKRVACATWNLKFFCAEEKLSVGKSLLKYEKGIKWAAESAERSCQIIHDPDMALSKRSSPNCFKLCGRRLLELADKGTRYWLQNLWKPFAVVKLLPKKHLSARKLSIHKVCKCRIYEWFCHCNVAWAPNTPDNSKTSMGIPLFFNHTEAIFISVKRELAKHWIRHCTRLSCTVA